jgi:hypothetical protein
MIIWHAEHGHDKNAEFYRDLLVELKKTFPNLRSVMFSRAPSRTGGGTVT